MYIFIQMIYPAFLSSGDKVAIVAPAGRIGKNDLVETLKVLDSWGLEVVVGEHVFDMYNYFSSSDIGRYQDLQRALDDPHLRAIFCARGGYGTGKIIDKLDFTKFAGSPKWVIGFSDITLLHMKLHMMGIASLHGPVARQLGVNVDNESVEMLRQALFEMEEIIYHIPANDLDIAGHSMAPIIGGNLTLLCNNIGSQTDIDLKDKILFVEEIDEKIYAFDRSFNQLDRSGKLKDLKGIISGQFTSIKDTDPSFGKSVNEIAREYADKYDFPIGFGLESGHDIKNLTIPFSFICDFEIDSSGSLLKFYRG